MSVNDYRRVRVLNESSRPDEDVEPLIEFVLDRSGGIQRSLAIKLADGQRGAYAAHRGEHSFPKWAGRARYAVRVSVYPDDSIFYGQPGVCGHASHPGARVPAPYWRELYDAGGRWVGRWPLYEVHNWKEKFVHLFAHETMHVIQFDRGRRSRSEVACEVFAVRLLDEYRAEVSAILKV